VAATGRSAERTLWRISSYANLNGEGAKLASARWHTRGNPVVYLAESPAGALLERMVHLQEGDGRLPRSYTLLEITAPPEVGMKELSPTKTAGWREDVRSTQRIGDKWLASGETALARVPSVIVPRTWNVLLNPQHPDAGKVRIESVSRERFDERLLGRGAR
jgi:RES domain-containing protein